MTQTPPPGGGQPGPRGADTFFTGLRRIDMRRSQDSWIGGVCSGLAERLGVDALVIRALFVVLTLGMGLGVMLYLAAWLLIPNRQEETHLELALRDGRAESVVLLVVAVLSLFGSFGWFGGGWWADGGFFGWGVITLVIVGLGAWWLWSEWTKREQPGFYGQRADQYAGPAGTGGQGTGGATAWTPGTDETTSSFATPATETTDSRWGGETGGQASAWSADPNGGWGSAEGSGPGGPSGGGPSAPQGPGGWQSRPRAPKPPPAPRRPGRRSAGAAGTLLGLGLALTAGGGLAWAAAEYAWGVNPLVIGLVGALGSLGLVILVLGLAGRTSGFPGFVAVVALLVTAAVLPIGDHFVPSGRVGDYTWAPDAGDTGPYRLGAGTGTLDLRGADGQDLTGPITATVSFGTLRVLVPDDVTVRVEAGAGMGGIVHGDPRREVGGVNVGEEIVVGDGPVELEVEARVGFGQVVVEGDGR
ncbi:PspC domain-containing protein [Ornithinimicrobium cavernae]|uniref:PspC domain-containing protein n=1 Tax=Ornithinimicrobium cavernae TaxID=2666047 RepID=UPI000D69CF8B|nr:PspC domain-containing protein [Ornithinimicrobium cavernae]